MMTNINPTDGPSSHGDATEARGQGQTAEQAALLPYQNRASDGNSARHRTGKTCIEAGCNQPAGTAWSPHWCVTHNIERMDRISSRFGATRIPQQAQEGAERGAGETVMRTFTMYRRNVPSETHDENQRNATDEPQFEGVVFTDGSVAIRWRTAKRSTSVWDSLDDMLAIHGHPEYGSELVWHAAAATARAERAEDLLKLVDDARDFHMQRADLAERALIDVLQGCETMLKSGSDLKYRQWFETYSKFITATLRTSTANEGTEATNG